MPNNNTPNNEWEKQYQREYRRIVQAINRQKKLGYFVPEEIKPVAPTKKKTVTQHDVETLIQLTPKKIRKSSIYVDKETGESFEGLDVVNSHHKARPSKAKVGQTGTQKAQPKLPHIKETGERKRKKKQKQKTPQQDTPKQNVPETPTFSPPTPTAPPIENNLNKQIVDTISAMLSEWQPAPHWHASFLQRKTENYHKILSLWNEILDTEGEYEVAYRLESNATELIRLLERLLYSSDSTIEDDFNMGRFIELLIGRALTAVESDWYSEMAREAAMDSLRGENTLG